MAPRPDSGRFRGAASATLLGEVETILEGRDRADLPDLADQTKQRLLEAWSKLTAAPFAPPGVPKNPKDPIFKLFFSLGIEWLAG